MGVLRNIFNYASDFENICIVFDDEVSTDNIVCAEVF